MTKYVYIEIVFTKVYHKYGMENKIQGLENYTLEEIESLMKEHIEGLFSEYSINAEIYKIHVHGSRVYGTPRKDSDLDIVVFYTGKEREDDMFNMLNEEPYYIEDIKCDINPIEILPGDDPEERIKQYIQEHDIEYNHINECGEGGVPGGAVFGDVAGMGPIEFPHDGHPGSGDLPLPSGRVYQQVAPFGSFVKTPKLKKKRKRKLEKYSDAEHTPNALMYDYVDDFRTYVERTKLNYK